MDREVPETRAGSLAGEQCDEAIINAAESIEDIAGVVEVMRLDIRSVPIGELHFFTDQAEALARHLPSMAKDLGLSTVGELLRCEGASSWLKRDRPGFGAHLLATVRELCLDELLAPIAQDRAAAGEIPAGDAALLRRARADGVEAALLATVSEVSFSELDPYASHLLEPEVRGRTIREVLVTLPGAQPPQWARPLGERGRIRLRAAAWRLITEEVARVRAAADVERAREAELDALEEPNLSKFDEMLREAYQVVRRSAPPLPFYDHGAGDLTIDDASEPPIAVYGGWAEDSVRLVLSLGGPESPDATCTCSTDRPARCWHVLQAISALRMRLREGEDELTSLAERIVAPAWVRALRAVDEILDGAARPGEVLGWALQAQPDDPGLRLWPVFVDAEDTRVKRAAPLTEADDHPRLLAADRAVLDHLAAVHDPKRSQPGARTVRRIDDRGLLGRSLRALAGHPRVYLRSGSGHQATYAPLDVEIEPVELGLADDGSCPGTVVPNARIGRRTLSFAALRRKIEDERWGPVLLRLDQKAGRCSITPVPNTLCGVVGALAHTNAAFPPEAQLDLFSRLTRLEPYLPLGYTETPTERRDTEARLFLRIDPVPRSRRSDVALEVSILVRPLLNGPALTPGVGREEVLAAAGGDEPRILRGQRDLARERSGAVRLREALNLDERRSMSWVLRGERALDLIAEVDRRADDIEVEWPKDGGRPRIRRARPRDLRVSLTSEHDWFGLRGEVVVDGQRIALALLLETLRGERRYVRLSEEEWVEISEGLRRKLSRVRSVLRGSESELTLGPESAPVLFEFEQAGLLEPTTAWSRLAAQWKRVEAIDAEETESPMALDATLRPYQLAGLRFIRRLAAWGVGGCLADDMGLGKTVQTLAAMVERAEIGPQVVVAPASVCANWRRECERFAPSLETVLHHEIPRDDRDAVLKKMGRGQILVTSYDLVARDEKRLGATRWATLVLDEAQYVKSARSRRSRAVRKIDAELRLALTGTPVENHLAELYGLFNAVAPGLLGGWEHFRQRFALPIERNGDGAARRALADLIGPFVLRRTKEQVAPELPPKTEIQIDVELTSEEQRIYDDARIAAAAHLTRVAETLGLEQAGFEVLAALTRLRQLACHARLVDPTYRGPSAKLERLLSVLMEIREAGHRALVFSQFVSHLGLVREALEREGVSYLYLAGGTPPAERSGLVDAFQAGEAPLFLISLKAGGTGLNLTAADYVVHLDPWWNPAVEDQATDRAHRIGQSRPVTVLRLVARGTIEEDILALHERKRRLLSELIGDGAGQGAAAAPVSQAELLALISGGNRRRVDREPEGEGGDAPAYCELLGIPTPNVETRTDRQLETVGDVVTLALLEHGGPMTVEEIAARLREAGVLKDKRDPARSIGRAAVQAPIVREPDGRLGLDLGSRDRHWKYILGRLGGANEEPVTPEPIEEVEGEAEEPPGDHIPLTQEELEAAFRDQSMTNVSSLRQAAMMLDASGGRLAFAQVEQRLDRLTSYRSPLRPHGWEHGLVTLDEDGSLVLQSVSSDVSVVRRFVRERVQKRVPEIREEERRAREFAARRAEVARREAEEEALALSRRRGILHLSRKRRGVDAGVLVDLSRGQVQRYEVDGLRRLASDLEEFDVIAGLDIRESVRALNASVDPTRLLELTPRLKHIELEDGRKRKVKIEDIIEGTIGDVWSKNSRDLIAEATDLARLYEYGRLHDYVLLLDAYADVHRIEVAYAEEGDPSLSGILHRAKDREIEVELVLEPPTDWRDPWKDAGCFQVDEISYGAATVCRGGLSWVIRLDDVRAARVRENFSPQT